MSTDRSAYNREQKARRRAELKAERTASALVDNHEIADTNGADTRTKPADNVRADTADTRTKPADNVRADTADTETQNPRSEHFSNRGVERSEAELRSTPRGVSAKNADADNADADTRTTRTTAELEILERLERLELIREYVRELVQAQSSRLALFADRLDVLDTRHAALVVLVGEVLEIVRAPELEPAGAPGSNGAGGG